MASQSDDQALRLMLISDAERWSKDEIAEKVRLICQRARPGSVVVQLRDRQLPTQERLELGMALAKAAREAGQCFVVNERVDMAVLLEADGVHLPEQSLSPHDARRLLLAKGRQTPWISAAWHDIDQDPVAGATAYVLSPIMAERKGRTALGTGALGIVRAKLGPGQLLFALGGIDASNAADCLRAGADGVAVMGAAFAADPVPLLQALKIERH